MTALKPEMRPTPQTAGGVTALDLAWERINALGGAPDNESRRTAAINETVGKCLDIIESLGGSDPVPKRAAWLSRNTRSRISEENTHSRIDEVECPSCRARRDNCRLCGGIGVVTEQQALDWPATP